LAVYVQVQSEIAIEALPAPLSNVAVAWSAARVATGQNNSSWGRAAAMVWKLGIVHALSVALVTTCLWVPRVVVAGDAAPVSAAVAGTPQVSAFYLFRSWENPDKLVMILNVAAAQAPAGGPDFPAFQDAARYRINIDNDMDGVASNVVYEFRFATLVRTGAAVARGLPWPATGSPRAANPRLRGITALEGSGAAGLGVRQTYTLTEIKHGERHEILADHRMFAVPANAGTATMPDYEALAAQGIYADPDSGIRVFAGPRAQTDYTDAGALYDGVNLRRNPPFLTAAEDSNGMVNPFGVNTSRNANVLSIAIEIPIARLTHDGRTAAATQFPLIGAYGSISRRMESGREDDHRSGWRENEHGWLQVSRMGNPTFRAFVVDNATKSKWDAAAPEDDAQFQNLLKAPAFSQLLSEVVGLPVPPPPRLELLQIIFKYPGQTVSGTDCGTPCADLLRINVQVPPTPAQSQQRLGALLSSDLAGLPNGCRPADDVADITLRAFGGPAYFAARIGDGVNFFEAAPGAGTADGPGYGAVPGNHLDVAANGVVAEFPFMPTPHDGRDGAGAF